MVLIVRGLINLIGDDSYLMAKRNVLKAFGERVREIRAQKGLSQEELARIAGIDRTYIGGIERGERNAGIKNVWRIADALNVPAAELFREGASNSQH